MSEELTMSSTKLSNVRFRVGSCNISVPELVTITGAVEKYKYVKGERTNEIEKIVLQLKDTKALSILKQAKVDASNVQAFTAEIQDPKLVQRLEGNVESLITKEISTSGSFIALRWVTQGRSGGWNGLKLIIDVDQLVSKKEG